MNWSVILWLIILFSIFLSITLFGELPQFQGTWLAKLRHAIFLIPSKLVKKQTLQSIWDTSEPYLRWGIPIGYIALISGCIYVFLTDVYPELLSGEAKLSAFHTSLMIPLVISLPYISSTLAILSDPGYITSNNHARIMNKFRYDNILFMEDNECTTCKKTKPARSKHCRSCNICISMSDHHCVFLNRCIGYNNIRWFLFFVSSNSLMLGYGFYILRRNLAQHVQNIVSSPPLSHDYGFLNYSAWLQAILENKSNGALMLLTSTLFIIATAFLGEHIKYIYLGVTTNETLKWEGVKDCMDDGTLFFYDHPTLKEREESHQLNENSIVLQRLDNEYNRSVTESEIKKIQSQKLVLKPLTDFEQINNIYDLGFWRNLKSRLFPSPL